MRQGFLFVLCAIAFLGCAQKNAQFEKIAQDNNEPYELVEQVETLFQESGKAKRLTDAQWKQVEDLSRNESVYARTMLIFVMTGLDRTDAKQRERALGVLGRLKQDSDPEVRKYAESGYARMQRIPAKGP